MHKPFGLFVEVAGETRCLAILSTRRSRAERVAKTFPLRVEGAKTFLSRASSNDCVTAQPTGDRISLGQRPTWLEATGHNTAAIVAPSVRREVSRG